MKKKIIIVIVFLLLVFLLSGVLKYNKFSNSNEQESKSKEELRSSKVPLNDSGSNQDKQDSSSKGPLAFAAAYLTPIRFFGKVVDQHGVPIPGAEVEYSGNNVPWGGSKRSKTDTDAQGMFDITSMGISLFVTVSKDSYRQLHRRSNVPPEQTKGEPFSSESFYYSKLFGSLVHQPDKSHPVVFTLHKSGELEPLITVPRKDIIMAKDGSPIRVELNPGNPKTMVEMQCWTDDNAPNAERQYDWRFKMTFLSGGFEERLDEIAFIAPASGYKERIFNHKMLKELPGNQWKDVLEKSFFVRFDDQTYAILDVKMISGGGNFVVVSSLLNPKTGSRNLETAPPKKRKYR